MNSIDPSPPDEIFGVHSFRSQVVFFDRLSQRKTKLSGVDFSVTIGLSWRVSANLAHLVDVSERGAAPDFLFK